MTAPVLLSAQYDDANLTLYLIYDRAVTGTVAQELDGYTFTLTLGGPIVPVFSSFDNNAIVCSLPGVVGADTLTVDYNDAVGNTIEAVAPNDPVASFTGEVAVTYYAQPLVRRACVAFTGNNDDVTIFFSEPVASISGDLLLGLTIEYDDVALDLSGATAALNDDQTELTITTGTNASYDTIVDVIYDESPGDLYTWPSGLVADFTLNDIDNKSTDGLPNSDYPLSVVIGKPVVVCQNVATGCIDVNLNIIDQELVKRYGPVELYTGGTFGVTVGNPAGITVVGGMVPIVDGAEICLEFNSAVDVAWATDAALDWTNTMVSRVGIALGTVRTTDQGVTLGDRTINQV